MRALRLERFGSKPRSCVLADLHGATAVTRESEGFDVDELAASNGDAHLDVPVVVGHDGAVDDTRRVCRRGRA